MKPEKKPIDFALPLRHFVGVVFFLIIAVTCIQVISRYVFNRSLDVHGRIRSVQL